jgi:hypothetical protein
MLLPKTVDGKPYSVLKLKELCAVRKESPWGLIDARSKKWEQGAWTSGSPSASEWVLIPKRDPDRRQVRANEHFRGKGMRDQARVLKHYSTDCREARALEVMTAAILTHLVSDERILEHCVLRVMEPSGVGGRVQVGLFGSAGLNVFTEDNGRKDHSNNLGPALARRTRV